MTTIYLIRHSRASKDIIYNDTFSLQYQNENLVLSSEGEMMASLFSKKEFLKTIDVVISSHYIRALGTAKYIAENNGKNVFVMEEFGERKHGVSSWDELPSNFEQKQFLDSEFKVFDGESRSDVSLRMNNALKKVFDSYKNKTIAIVSHATAITFLLMSFGYMNEEGIFINDKLILPKDFIWNNLDTIKLKFDDQYNLLDAVIIKNDIL